MSALSPEMQALLDGAEKKYASKQAPVLKVKEGTMLVRILVPDPSKPFWADRGQHWIKADIKDKPIAVMGCNAIVNNERCSVCEAIDRAMRSTTDEDSKKLVQSWKARGTVLLQVYVPLGPDKSDKAQILEVTKSFWSSILEVLGEWGTDATLALKRTGRTVTDTEYTVMPSPKPVGLPDGILATCIDLKTFVQNEDFREDETKALKAIASITGVALPAPARPAALSSSSAGGVDMAALTAASPTPGTPTPAPAPAPAPAPKHVPLDEVVPSASSAPSSAPSTASLDVPLADDELERLLAGL